MLKLTFLLLLSYTIQVICTFKITDAHCTQYTVNIK